ncbi:adhesion G protein-coupled receptor E5 isoform X2 [Elgaria multicarinata webbii]|uniref:adhesion G protein-coupled receptor E5 isoform X2 n=1 Tax=Elgaria multicarinata webbii TaxID=159646 RepID=UPI002FCD2C44
MKSTLRLLLALGLFTTLIQSKAVSGGTVTDQDEHKGDCVVVTCGKHATQMNCGTNPCECISGFHFEDRMTKTFRNETENNCTDINECLTPNRCDKSANCTNFMGSYSCQCQETHFPYTDGVHGGENTTKCKALNCPVPSSVDCSDGQALLCKFKTQLGSLCNVTLGKKKLMDPKEHLQKLMDLLDDVVCQVNSESKSKEQKLRIATEIMAVVESFLRDLALVLPNSINSFGSSKSTELAIERRTKGSQNPARLSHEETQMVLDWKAASGEGEAFSLIGLLSYRSLGLILTEADVKGKEWEEVGKSPEWAEVPGKRNYKVLTRVTSAFVNHNETTSLNIPVTFNFRHEELDSKPDQKVICAFWEPVNGSGRWSDRGCRRLNASNATHTHCQCSHMTSFAVLMAFYDVEDRALTIITKVGLVVSLICLFFSILTFLFCRAIRGIRTTIHLHLCLALFAGHVTFLMGAGNTSNTVACAVVAGLLHYFFLSVFCWMMLEGVELYLMVVQVFKTHSLRHWHIFLVGYGLPAIVVGISAAINSKGYGSKNCWLSKDRGFLWSFLAPVSFIIVVNAIVFVITVWRLSEKFSDINPDMSKLKKQRVLTITAIAQLCILGTTWVFGLFQFSEHTLVMSYLFTISNSLQGLFIFLLHCVLKKQVRDDYYRWFCKGKLDKNHSSDKYTDFSSTAGSNTLRANKSFKKSEI